MDPSQPLSAEQDRVLSDIIARLGERKLRKTRTSERTRLMFIAGLEGSGHHMVETMFKQCVAAQPALCKHEKELPKLLFWATRMSAAAEKGVPGAGLGPKFTVDGLFGAQSYVNHGNLVLKV
jgi:hypothetical protein